MREWSFPDPTLCVGGDKIQRLITSQARFLVPVLLLLIQKNSAFTCWLIFLILTDSSSAFWKELDQTLTELLYTIFWALRDFSEKLCWDDKVSNSFILGKILFLKRYRCQIMASIFKNFIYLFIYLWLCWVFVSVRGLSLVAASRGHSSSRCLGLSLSWPLVAEHRLQTRRLSSCGSRT